MYNVHNFVGYIPIDLQWTGHVDPLSYDIKMWVFKCGRCNSTTIKHAQFFDMTSRYVYKQ